MKNNFHLTRTFRTRGLWHNLQLALVLLVLGLSTNVNAQLPDILPECINDVPLLYVDLSSNPDSTYISPTITRTGNCCGASNQIRFISFYATLHPNAAMVEIGVAEGADPYGSGEYHFVDGGDLFTPGTCVAPIPAGQPVCIPPGLTGPNYKIAFGKPGNNANKFFFRQILKPTFPQDDSTRVGCSLPLDIYGLENTVMQAIATSDASNPSLYNNLIDLSDPIHPVFSPGVGTPLWIDYEICGTQEASTVCGVYETCDTVRLYTLPRLTVSVTPDPAAFCSGGSVTLHTTVNGGDGNYLYEWFDGSTPTPISYDDTLVVNTEDTYEIRIEDGLISPTCPAATYSIPVTEGQIPTADAGPDTVWVCADNPVVDLIGSVTNASGGTWSGGTGTFDPSADSLFTEYTASWSEINSGSVTLTLETTGADASCTTGTDSIVIMFSDTVFASPSYAPLVCNGDLTVINANATGGTPTLHFIWSTGTSGSTINASAGTYSVTVTDSIGCTATESITVVEPSPIVLTTSSTAESVDGACDGELTVSASGGSGSYIYDWDNDGTGDFDDPTTISGLCYGVYTVTVEDSYGCQSTISAVVNNPTCSSFDVSVLSNTDLACYGDSDAQATASATGGAGGYSYSWNTMPVQTTATATGLSAGTYTVTATDALGCINVDNVTILQPTVITNTMTWTDVTSMGGSDGTATANPLGGVPGYSYTWFPAPAAPQTTQTANNLTQGTYYVNIEDINSCVKLDSVHINQPPCNDFFVYVTKKNITCNGLTDGYASIYISQGSGSYTISWSSGQTNVTSVSGLAAGSYSVTVTDDVTNCTTFATFDITEPNPLTISLVPTNVTCNGAGNGTIDLTVTGGTFAYDFAWDYGTSAYSENEDLVNLAPGSYSVTVTDHNGCIIEASTNITQPAKLKTTPESHDITCHGAGDGYILIESTTGGTAPFTYSWTGPNSYTASTGDIYGLESGQYYVTTTDANGCTHLVDDFINEPDSVRIVEYTVPCPAPGASNVTVTIDSISGGVNNVNLYEVSFDNGSTYLPQGTYSTSLPVGATYNVVARDTNGCTSLATVITIDPNVDISLVDFNPCIAPGTTNIDITVTPNGGDGGPYEVSTDGGSTFNAAGTYVLSVPVDDMYDVVVRDTKGCESLPWTITVPAPFDSDTTVTMVTCPGEADGAIDLSVTGGTMPYTYLWSNSATTQDISGLTAGTYDVTITDDSSCVINMSIDVNTIVDVTNPIITSCGAGSQNVVADPGVCTYTNNGFAWDAIATDNCTVVALAYNLTGATTGSGTSLDGVDFNLGVTTVTWTATDGSGNTAQCSFNITVSDDQDPTFVSCGAGGNQNVDSDPGFCTYTHSGTGWDAVGDDNCTSTTVAYVLTGATTGSGTSLNNVVFELGSTLVTWTVTDGSNNTAQCSYYVIVSDNEDPAISSCGASGTQNVVTDPDECSYTNIGTGWNATATDNCSISSLTYSLSGATTGSGTTLNNVSFGLGTTTVTWTVTDGSGNTDQCTFDVVVTDNELPVFSDCGPSGDQTVEANLGVCTYTYSGSGWNASATDNCTVSSVTYVMTGATTGSGTTLNGVSFELGLTQVTWTVTDASGNTNTCSFNVTVIDDQDPVISSCGATGTQNVSTDAGVCTYTQTGTGWDATATDNCTVSTLVYTLTGATTGTGISLDGVSFAQGTTTVTWTATDGSGNTDMCSFNVIVTDNEVPVISGCPSDISVNTDPGACGADVFWTPPTYSDNCGATMTWTHDPGDTFPVGTTTVAYTVTDGTGNVSVCTFDVIVTDNELPQLTCSTDIATCDPLVSWAPVTASDNCGITSVTLISGLPSGSVFPVGTTTVTYEAIDANGNSNTCSFDVTIHPTPVLSTVSTDISCFGFGDGSIDLTVTTGTAPYTYNWSNGGTTEDLNNLTEGIYSVTVTDVYGCSASTSDTISEPAQLLLNKDVTQVSCNGGNDGAIDITVSGGTLPYTYFWTNGATTEDLSGLTAGVYSIEVTDANGCVATNSTAITEPDAIDIQHIVTDATCGAPNGAIQVQIIGGTTPYSYLWSNGSTNLNLTNAAAGTYTLTVTDINGCTAQLTDSIGSSSNLSGYIISTDVKCYDGDDGSARVLLESGNAPYTYMWSNGDTTALSEFLTAGPYSVTVTDDFGCQITLDVDINQPDSLYIELYSPEVIPGFNISPYGNDNGSITSNVVGGTPEYEYFWIPTGSISEDLYGLDYSEEGYTLTVTDANRCTATATIMLLQPYPLEMPEGLSPNDDGDNDYFVVRGLEAFPDNDITIYNRWGNVVYEQKGYQNDWQGDNMSGEPLPDGTYFAILNARDGGGTITLQGYIDLRRNR